MSHHNNLMEQTVHNFGAALNSGDIAGVLSFFSEEGNFMPDGYKTFNKNQIGKSGSKFLADKDFKIEFKNVKITINDHFAFVEAVSKTSENDEGNSSKLEKTSRDFFVFKREKEEWRIFNYIFNNVKVSKFDIFK